MAQLIHLHLGGNARDEKTVLAIVLALLIGEGVLGTLYLCLALPVCRLQGLDLQPCAGEACLCFLHRDAKRRIVETEENAAFLNELIVAHINLAHPPPDVAADHRLRSLHIGIIGRLIASAGEIEVERAREHHERCAHHEWQAQPLAG